MGNNTGIWKEKLPEKVNRKLTDCPSSASHLSLLCPFPFPSQGSFSIMCGKGDCPVDQLSFRVPVDLVFTVLVSSHLMLVSRSWIERRSLKCKQSQI